MLVATITLSLLVAASLFVMAAIRAHEAAATIVARVDARPLRQQLAELERRREQLHGLLDDRSRR